MQTSARSCIAQRAQTILLARSRCLHQAAMSVQQSRPAPPPLSENSGSRGRMKRRTSFIPIREGKRKTTTEMFERCLQSLEKIADAEKVEQHYLVPPTLSLTDSELEDLYNGLVELPGREASLPLLAKPGEQLDAEAPETNLRERDMNTIQDITARFAPQLQEDPQEDLQLGAPATTLLEDLGFAPLEERTVAAVEPSEPHRLALFRIHQLLARLDAARDLAQSMASSDLLEGADTSSSLAQEELEEDSVLGEVQVQAGAPAATLTPGVLSQNEFNALLRYSVSTEDAAAAELALELGRRTNQELSERQINDVLTIYAARGDYLSTERVLRNYMINGKPTTDQVHLHIKSHLKSITSSSYPTAALSVLHAYENGVSPLSSQPSNLSAPSEPLKGLIPPIKTYTSLITHLFSCGDTTGKTHAWDLFSHMRYVSHPVPDERMYAMMIRACAYSPTPGGTNAANPMQKDEEQTTPYPHTPSLSGTALVGPERAMDLWTEMTMDQRMVPSKAAYNAIILACARSGEDQWVREGWRLVERMREEGKRRVGDDENGGFAPDKRTFLALLEGTKRTGDLGRARWILAEMIKSAAEGDKGMVTDEAMQHVFHTYASYKPPFKRGETRIVDGQEEQSNSVENTREDAASSSLSSEPATEEALDEDHNSNFLAPSEPLSSDQDVASTSFDLASAFSVHPPQTRAEVLREATMLFHQILSDTGNTPYPTDSEREGAFRNVAIGPRLLNAYISVHSAHSDLYTVKRLYETLFAHPVSSFSMTVASPTEEIHSASNLGLAAPNAMTYVDVLERCANAWKRDRNIAAELGERVWADWTVFERSQAGLIPGFERSSKISARVIERAHIARMKILSKSDDVHAATDHLQTFFTMYPPQDLTGHITPTKPFRSTRTILVGARPIVRLSSAVEQPDDAVPPFLRFSDLQMLHTSLVRQIGGRGPKEKKAKQGLGQVKYICKAYEAALRSRRNATVTAPPISSLAVQSREDEMDDLD